MEASGSCSSRYDDEARMLEGLLEIFGSTFSLKEIASAFCKAGRNADLAAGLLAGSQECPSSTTTDVVNADLSGDSSSELLPENDCKDSVPSDSNFNSTKPKRYPVSVGTVSSVLGKGYSRPTSSSSGSLERTKPKIINLKDLPTKEVNNKGVVLESTTRRDAKPNDVEEFLFKMLGDGFQLHKDVIHEVLGSCGYDANETIEKLVDLSASTLKKSNDIVDGFSEKFGDEDPKPEYALCKAKSEKAGISQRNRKKAVNQETHDLQKEVLTSLFNVPGRIEEVPRRTGPVRAVKHRRGAFGTIVSEPLRDLDPEPLADMEAPLEDIDYEEDERYRALRRAAKEHWMTMKEYYKAAVHAFAAGNRTLAEELLEKGQDSNSKAREADEKSAQQILECRKKENQDLFTLDLHEVDAKGALRLLKLNLTSLSGIADQLLKVIIETDDEDTTKGARKRLVMKLLQRESIKWTEQGGGKTIMIRLDEIDPTALSFAKKSV